MNTKEQTEVFKQYMMLSAQFGPKTRDVICKDLTTFEPFARQKPNVMAVKVRQCRDSLFEEGFFVVTNMARKGKAGMFVATKSTDFDIEISYAIKSAVTILRKAKLLKREQNRLRLLEGIETPENQLPLEQQQFIQEAEQLRLELQ